MKKIINHLKKLQNISLSKSERAQQWDNIKSYAEFNPIDSESIGALNHLSTENPVGFGIFSRLKAMPVIASFLILFLGGGTAFAAEGAVPGDVLYPVKTEITENLRGAFATDAEAQANFEAWRAERRLDETQKLVARRALTDDRKNTLEKRFQDHASQVEVRIAAISETNPELAAELSSEFEASLAAHDALLASIDATTTESTRGIVRASIDRIAFVRANALGGGSVATRASATFENAVVSEDASTFTETRVAPTEAALPPTKSTAHAFNYDTAATRLLSTTEKELEDTEELYEKIAPELSEAQQMRIKTALKEVDELFDTSVRAYNAGEFEAAYRGFANTLPILKKIMIFLTSEARGTVLFPESEPVDEPTSLPVPRPLPPVIDLSNEIDANAQIDPPSLELDTGPEDTDVPEEKGENSDDPLRIKVRF